MEYGAAHNWCWLVISFLESIGLKWNTATQESVIRRKVDIHEYICYGVVSISWSDLLYHVH